jgi:ABC-type multidrug transport system fused ATPase/permease subunit
MPEQPVETIPDRRSILPDPKLSDQSLTGVRWVLSLMSRVKGGIALTIVLFSAEIIFTLYTYKLDQLMIDEVLLGGHRERFWPLLSLIALSTIAYSLLFTFGPSAMSRTTARIRTILSRSLMATMYRLPVKQLHKERTANYVYHFTNDLTQSASLIAEDIPRTIQQIVGGIVLVIILFSASPYIVAGILLFGVVYALMGKRFSKRRKAVSSEVNRTRSNLLVHLEEGVSATREVVAFRRQEWESKSYKELFSHYYDSVIREAKLINIQLLFSDPLKNGAILFVLFYGGLLVLDHRLSIGLFVISFQCSSRLMDSIHAIYNAIMNLSSRMAAVDRLRGLLGAEVTPDGSSRLQADIRELVIDQVTFRYNEQSDPVLDSISLQFPIGQKIALVGTSGGGKSTIAGLLARFYEPESGVVRVNGEQLDRIVRHDWVDKVTVVFQEPYLFPDTIRSNLLLGCEDVSDEQMTSACRAMSIHDVIAKLPDGYDTVIGERGITLSGGQRQRLALARAVLRNTEVLILDEATSSLDLETERDIQHKLDELRRGRTTIIIAHRLSTILNADIIYVLDNGKVAESGTHNELMSKQSVYRSLVLKMNEELNAAAIQPI